MLGVEAGAPRRRKRRTVLPPKPQNSPRSKRATTYPGRWFGPVSTRVIIPSEPLITKLPGEPVLLTKIATTMEQSLLRFMDNFFQSCSNSTRSADYEMISWEFPSRGLRYPQTLSSTISTSFSSLCAVSVTSTTALFWLGLP